MSEAASQQEQSCLNCGEPAPEKFCARCGQATKKRRVPFLAIAGEILGDFFSLDSTVLRGIVPLLFRPGHLTRSYVEGKRASQLAPARLYLFLSLVFFLFFRIPTPEADDMTISVGGEELVGSAGDTTEAAGEGESTAAETSAPIELRMFDVTSSNPVGRFFQERITAQEERFRGMEPQELVDTFVETANSVLPKALILFVPIVALILKFLYIGTGWLYFDHFVFSLHLQSALLLSLLLALPVALFTGLGWSLPLGALLAGPVYLMLALRKTYQDRLGTLLLRTALFLFGYVGSLLFLILGVTFYVTLAA